MADFEQQEERLRQPPHSQDAEQAVLAGVLLDANMWNEVDERVSAPDFYNRAHQLIYKAMESVAGRNQEALDVVTVADALREAGELDNCGGTAYLASLADAYGSAQNVAAYADIVREASILRALLKSSGEIAQSVYQPEGRSAAQLLDSAEQRVFDIKNQYQQHKEDGFHPIKNVLADTVQYLQEVSQRGSDVIGIPTGIAHQQPVPDHDDGSAHNSHDQGGVRPEEHHSAMVIEPRGTGDQYQEHGGRLSTEEEQNAHHELDPAEPLRLPRRDTPLGADRNESVQDASGPGSRHGRPGGNGGAHGPMFPPPGVTYLLLEDQIMSRKEGLRAIEPRQDVRFVADAP